MNQRDNRLDDYRCVDSKHIAQSQVEDSDHYKAQ